MVRKQLYLEASQDRLLKRWARERGTTEAELVREAIAWYASSPRSPAASAAWQQEVAFMRRLLAEGPLPERERRWRRADLYAERLERYERHFR